jgi:hypothetical protein
MVNMCLNTICCNVYFDGRGPSRVVTHIFNHQGQVLAMCRTIGKPNDTHDLDYPVD